ncbi:MAG: N-acetylglucosamine-6-phosphate deacetylase [Carbonactinosporaceae bacterium]
MTPRTKVIAAPRVVGGAHRPGVLEPGWVSTSGDRITQVGAGSRPDADLVLTTGILAPGLVDLQVNGAYGVDFASVSPDQWCAVTRRLPETGVTSLVPTCITAPIDGLTAALARYREIRPLLDAARQSARTLGVHLEGPFISERFRGAHDAQLLRDPTPHRVDALLAAGAGGTLLYVTLAPERPGGIHAVHRLTAAGVRVAVGHSDAREEVVRAAVDAGATLVTHLFNGQRPMRHRDPGVVGPALVDQRLTCGLIVDLHHVFPTAIRLAFAAARGRIALVTDAVAAMGMPPGRYVLAGDVVEVGPGTPPRRPDGAFAGSVLRMDEAVARSVACGVSLTEALDAATLVPADAVGRADLGRLAPGALADLVWLSDELRARATWIGGDLAFADAAARPLVGAPAQTGEVRG